MIAVRRGDPPPGFQGRATQWSRRFADARSQDPTLSAAAFWRRVRSDLRADAAILAERFHYKCAYCEARMEHVQPPHIEHYRPKGRPEFVTRVFDWHNWLLCCGRCNESKWKRFPDCSGEPCLLDPAVDDPAEHLAFHRQEIEGLTERGEVTVRLLALDRSPLTRERASWLLRVETLLLLADCAREVRVREEARRLVLWCLQEDAPFCAMTRAYVADTAPGLASPPHPHPWVSERDGQSRIAQLVAEHRDTIRQLA